MLKILIFFLSLYSFNLYAESNLDQWEDSEKTYKDLVDEGFEVKAYDTNYIEGNNGLALMVFITVLQKNKDVYECQEYQTLDDFLQTLDISLVCRNITQPYLKGTGT